MTRDGAYPKLQNYRHAIYLTDDLQVPEHPLRSYVLRATYNRESERMRRFIREADASREQMEDAVDAFRQILAVAAFRTLLMTEGFATMPRTLADRIRGEQPNAPIAAEKANHTLPANGQLVGGICLEVLDLLQDCSVAPQVFRLLRKVVPSRQVESAQIMIALARVKINFAKVLVALTPQSQLAEPSTPRKQFAGITAAQLAEMEVGFAELSQEFRNCAECFGSWGLELVAVRGYLNRLMDSPKLVRCLAHHFPKQLAQFQGVLETA